MNDFDNADWFDAEDGECLTHESVEEALWAVYESHFDPGVSQEATIRECGPIELHGYRKYSGAETDGLFRGMVERAAENMFEQWADDHGLPDGFDADELLTDDAKEVLYSRLDCVIRSAFEHARSQPCKPCGKRTYSADEAIALLRDAGGYFDDEETGAAGQDEAPRGGPGTEGG